MNSTIHSKLSNDVTTILYKLRDKLKNGGRVNVMVMESSPNTSKVSLLRALREVNFNVFVLSHENSSISQRLYSGLNVTVIYGGGVFDLIKSHDIDILFIDHPHYFFDFTEPKHDFYGRLDGAIYSKALICYVPYAYISVSNSEAYTDFFHRFSWRFYLESNFHLFEYLFHTKNLDRFDNACVVGHPYMDPYFTDYYDCIEEFNLKRDNEVVLTWCPHHNPSFYNDLSFWDQERQLRKAIESNSRLIVVFRPHPNLLATLKSETHRNSRDYNTLMKEENLEDFMDFWFNHPRVRRIEKGPIYQVFKSSDVILHNCGGYQMEACVSGARIINTINTKLLSSHIAQFASLQDFPESPDALAKSIDFAISSGRRFDSRELYGAQAEESGRKIALNLLDGIEYAAP